MMIRSKFLVQSSFLLIFFVFFTTAKGATFVVTNMGDSNTVGSGSLRRAIFDANATAASDIIEFDPIVFATPQIIALTDNGDPVSTRILSISRFGGGLTINGRNVVTVTRSTAPGTRDFGIFDIDSTVVITINDLIITNGAGGGANRGIRTSGILTLNNCVVRDNPGGGIAGDGQITINNSNITGNSNGGINNGGTLAINNSSVTNNTLATTVGPGIFSNGAMTINNSSITGNSSGTGTGGAIAIFGGTVTISNSSLSGNMGGGIFTNNDTSLTITGSAISNNTTTRGGSAISSSAFSGFTRVLNSTISGNVTNGTDLIGASGINVTNSAPFLLINSTVSGNRVIGGLADYAGGIYNGGNLTITNSTITDNEVMGVSTARAGGVLTVVSDATVRVRNSIIAGNRNNGVVADVRVENAGSSFTSSGYNLIGNRGNVTAFNQTGDQTGTGAAPLNPQLAALANNGGPTLTHALLVGSTAINAGLNALALDANNQLLTTDQRGAGFPRFDSGTVDIGAFETQSAAPAVSISGRVLTPDGAGLRNARALLTDSNGVTRAVITNSFGNYQFLSVTSGMTYTIGVASKRFRFSSRMLLVTDNLTNVDFTGIE